MYDITFLVINDVDYVSLKNFTCGGNANHTLFMPSCLEVEALSLESTKELKISNSNINYLYADKPAYFINGPELI